MKAATIHLKSRSVGVELQTTTCFNTSESKQTLFDTVVGLRGFLDKLLLSIFNGGHGGILPHLQPEFMSIPVGNYRAVDVHKETQNRKEVRWASVGSGLDCPGFKINK